LISTFIATALLAAGLYALLKKTRSPLNAGFT